MTLDKSGAAEALAEIRQSQSRSASLYAYAHSAPYLFLTGLMWLIADEAFYFLPAVREWIWPVATLVAVPLYIGIAVVQGRRASSERKLDGAFWKGVGLWLVIVGLVTGTFMVFAPIHGVQVHSFIGLLTGAGYVALGLWMGARLVFTGLAIAALTLACHFYAGDHYTLLMGFIAGGGMMLSAVWMRRV